MLLIKGNDLTGCIPAALKDVRHNDFEDLDPPLPFCESETESADVEQITPESAFETLIGTPSKLINART